MKTVGLIVIIIGVIYFVNGLNAEKIEQTPTKVMYKVIPQKEFDTVFLNN
jgi:hypothetical protein